MFASSDPVLQVVVLLRITTELVNGRYKEPYLSISFVAKHEGTIHTAGPCVFGRGSVCDAPGDCSSSAESAARQLPLHQLLDMCFAS